MDIEHTAHPLATAVNMAYIRDVRDNGLVPLFISRALDTAYNI